VFFAFGQSWEPELGWLPSALPKGGTFVDVGACYGMYTLVAAKLVGGTGRVIAFEPAAEAYSVLRRNVQANDLSNATTRKVALKDAPGEARLFLHADPSRNSIGGYGDSGSFEQVKANTLDAEILALGRPKVHMMKIDAEGAEELVLRGAEQTLSISRPTIVFEHNPEAAEGLGLRPEGAWEILRRQGYCFWHLEDSGSLVPLPHPPAFGNVIATNRSA
jgi:FkbM family methyltransferase